MYKAMVQSVIFLWIVISTATRADSSIHDRIEEEDTRQDFTKLNCTLEKTLGDCTWIWGGDNPRPVTEFRLFHKEFILDYEPADAQVWGIGGISI